MELEITTSIFLKQKIHISHRVAFLLGGNCSGKTHLLNNLEKGFKGKSKKFLVNGSPVATSDYQILYLKDNFSFKEEIKLTKKSVLRNYLIQTMNVLLLEDSNYAGVTNKITKLAESMNTSINRIFAHNLFALTKPQIQLKFNTNKINLENIIDHLLDITLLNTENDEILENDFNQFLLRMLVFNILRSSLHETDVQRPIVILFDNPELYTNPYTMNSLIVILRELLNTRQFYLICATNSVSFITNFRPDLQGLNFIQKQKISSLPFDDIISKAIAFYHFVKQDEYEDWDWYWSDFQQVFNADDLLRETNQFYVDIFANFLHLFYFPQIELDVMDSASPTKNDKNVFYFRTIKEMLFLFFLLKYLSKEVSFSSKILQKYPDLLKINEK